MLSMKLQPENFLRALLLLVVGWLCAVSIAGAAPPVAALRRLPPVGETEL